MNFTVMKEFKRTHTLKHSPNGKWLVGLGGHQVKVYDAQTWELVHVFKGLKHVDTVSFAFGDEDTMVVQSTTKKVGVYQLSSVSPTIAFYAMTKSSEPQDCNIIFAPTNCHLVVGEYFLKDGFISTVDLETTKVNNIKLLSNGFVVSMNFDANETSYLFHINQLGSNIEKYGANYVLRWKYPFHLNEPEELYSELFIDFNKMKYNAVKKQFALFKSGILMISDEILTNEVARLNVDSKRGYFCDLNWTPDGKNIVVAYSTGAKIVRCKDMVIVKEIPIDFILTAEFSFDGKQLLLGTMESAYVIDVSEYVT